MIGSIPVERSKLFEKNIPLKSREFSVADPGFGQGGAKNFFPRFCRCSKAKLGEQSKQYNILI